MPPIAGRILAPLTLLLGVGGLSAMGSGEGATLVEEACIPVYAAPHPDHPGGDIIILDLRPHGDHVHVGSMVRIPELEGRGRHPAFLDHHRVLFSTHPGLATDGTGKVGVFDVVEGQMIWSIASPSLEDGPRPVPGEEAVTVIEPLFQGGVSPGGEGSAGGGILVRHELGDGGAPAPPSRLLPELEDIRGHAWAGPGQVALLRGGEQLELHLANLETGETRRIGERVGGRLESIPGTEDVAFVDLSRPDGPHLVRMEGRTGALTPVAELPPEGGVVAWLPGPTALLVHEGVLYRSTGEPDRPWHPILAVGPVTGLAASPVGLRIALVVPAGG
jgi:hypothetical protein